LGKTNIKHCKTASQFALYIGRSTTKNSRPDRFWAPPRYLYNGYRVFPGGKAALVWR